MMPLLPPPHTTEDRHHLDRVPPVLLHPPRSPTTTTAAAAAAMPPQTRGAASTSSTNTAPKKKPSSSSIFSLKCGCKDAKSVSVSSSLSDGSDKATAPADPAAAAHFSGRHHPPPALSARPETSSADTITFTTATTSTSHDDDEDDSPSFLGLLRQLNELERSVAAWDLRRGSSSRWAPTGRRGGAGEEEEEEEEGEGGKARRCSTHLAGDDKVSGKEAGGLFDAKGSIQQRGECRPRHRRTQSEGGGGRVLGKVGESVAVVKQTEDPLGDFRRSMLQMIVEKEILSGEELQELLCRFLALNSPSHHALIIRAFADIWRDVFSGYGRSPKAADLLVPPPVLRHGLPPYGRSRYYYSRRPSV